MYFEKYTDREALKICQVNAICTLKRAGTLVYWLWEETSQHRILDGYFSHTFAVKIVMFEKTKKRPGMAH